MKRNLIIRIVAIFLCALMLLSVVTAALYAYAADEAASVLIADTGSSNTVVWVIGSVAVALVAIVLCLVMPKKKK